MTTPTTDRALVGPTLVIVALLCQEIGASLAVHLFPAVGAMGMVALRLLFAAIVLMAVARPSIRGRSGASWRAVVAFGVVMAGMNSCFYLALERIPLGTAVTIEVLGPLVLSVVAGRRWLSVLWAAVALAGVVMLGGGAVDPDPLGMLLAFAAAGFWAAYILLSKNTGARFAGLGGLAIATGVGAACALPIAAVTAGSALLDPLVLLMGAAIAMLSTAIPYALDQIALRRIRTETFAVLLALAPAIAAAAGFLVLGQRLSLLELLGIAFVVAAGIGAVRARPANPASRVRPRVRSTRIAAR